MGRIQDQRRATDARRRYDKPWRKWYGLKAWKQRRNDQLRRVPYCEPCKVLGMSRPACIANHKIPHRGEWNLFIRGALESTCKPCHDSAIQRAENRGFRPDVDVEGWPTDSAHPFNKPRPS